MARRRWTILHTIQSGGPGGAETVILNLAGGLNPRHFRSIVLCSDGSWLPARLDERGIPCVRAPSSRWYRPQMLGEMARLVRREDVDLIHSHLPGQNFYACVVGRSLGRPTVVNYHGAVELQQSAGWRGAAQLWAVRHMASAVVVVCDQMARALGNAGFRVDRMTRIYNGIDTARLSAQPAGGLRRELGMAPEQPLVGMVANVRPPKGHDNFIRSARRVADRFPTARFAVAGEDLPGLSERLRAMVAELRLEERFSFLGFRSDIAGVLRDFDVFVLPSTSEGLPFVALEAMAVGRPSVMTRCGGPEELVEDGVSGYLVPIGDDAALAERVCDLLEDPARAAKLGRAAQERVRRQFSVEGMISAYERLYARLLDRRG